MKYQKPPLSFSDQAALLISRGMTGERDAIVPYLEAVSYYRLSGYWYPFRNRHSDHFKSGTTFDAVWERYVFDRQLRVLIMDAIERIEVAVRTKLAYYHSHRHGPFAYATDSKSLPNLNHKGWTSFVDRIQEEARRGQEPFVKHFDQKYGDSHKHLPVWMAIEVASFGVILTFFRGAPRKVKQSVATCFRMPEKVFDSWLHTLNVVRNICAHHGRLWNRQLGVKPLMPRKHKYPDWHHPVSIPNERVFGILSICKFCLARVAPQSRWPDRFRTLLADHPNIPIKPMGFPENWEDSPIWKKAE